jgi:hypothetical protein
MTMRIKLIDFEIEAPPNTKVGPEKVFEGRLTRDVVGPDAVEVKPAIEQRARQIGFTAEIDENERLVLERGEQRITVIEYEHGVTVLIDDPTRLPLARLDGSTIAINDVSIKLDGLQIHPRRERHDEGSGFWRAQWEIRGTSADRLVERVLDVVTVERGLKRGVTFAPPPSGAPTWRSEAYSTQELLKISATAATDHVLLELGFSRGGEPS